MAKQDVMDYYLGTTNSDVTGQRVQSGQRVQITRLVTIVYTVNISDVLEGLDETDISIKTLIQGEEYDNDISVELEYNGETDIVDTNVIQVEIL